MKRREFIVLGSAAVAWPLVARAQVAAMPVVGFIHPASQATTTNLVAAFRKGLSEGGFVDGGNVTIEFRWGEGQYDRLPALAGDLVQRQVSVIVANGGDPSVLAAKAATSTIPIVFNTGSDPVKLGLVASLARPGGNITGIGQLTAALAVKQLELLRELIPKISVVGLLSNPANPAAERRAEELQRFARTIGIELPLVDAVHEGDLDGAFARLVELRADAFLIVGDSLLFSRRDRIVALAARHRLPAIYSRREFTEIGGLMSYGANIAESYRLSGIATGQLLKGAKPADLPVEQSTKIEFVINARTARALDLTMPRIILARADEVIE